ncbi:hypothetical protein ACTPD5_22060, partial [Clostridioides difficile]|uniref:hypothetical protein n=1 Tax=Clostridioides difficile TaxID=1496 RepID=UPI003F8D5B0D
VEFDGIKLTSKKGSTLLFDIAVDSTIGPDTNQLIGLASHGSPINNKFNLSPPKSSELQFPPTVAHFRVI